MFHQSMQKYISLLLILALFAPAVPAQVKVRDKGAGEASLRKAEEAQRKAQAVDILKCGCIDRRS
jgi:hypothetical protein